jgi:hypothetical protein
MYYESSPLTIDGYFCANENHLNCYLSASKKNVPGEVIGELRADIWYKKDFDFTHKLYKDLELFDNLVVYLSFGEKNYIEPCFHSEIKGDWRELSSSIGKVLAEFVSNNPKTAVVYKMGHYEDMNMQEIENIKKESSGNFFYFDRSFDASALMYKSDVVIGFQSTATIEALCYDCSVIYPFWEIPEDVDIENQILPLHNYEQAFSIATSEIELLELLRKLIKSPNQLDTSKEEDKSSERAELIKKYFGYFDGNTHIRAEKGILSFID